MDELKDIEPRKEQKELALTEQNWKFLHHIRLGAKIIDAYKLAGYEGTSPNAAYVLYNTIKKKLQEVIESDGFDKLRLSLEMSKLVSLPLAESKQDVTFSEKLKALRLAHTIMSANEIKSPNQSFSVIILETGQPLKPLAEKVNSAKVIDIEPIEHGEPTEPSS